MTAILIGEEEGEDATSGDLQLELVGDEVIIKVVEREMQSCCWILC